MDAPREVDHRILVAAADGLTRAFAPVGWAIDRVARAGLAWRRALIVVGLIAPLLILYRQLLFAGEAWLDFDLLFSHQPRYQLLAEGLAEGRIPLWAPGMLGGFPIPFSEFGWFYPLTWLLLILFDPLRAYFVEIAVAVALAAAAGYWLARVWSLSRPAAFTAAFLFAYGPFVFATSRYISYADSFFALPAGIATLELIARGHRRYAALLALVTGIMAIAGHPQIALLSVFAWIAFGLFRLWWTWRDDGLTRAGRWLIWTVPAGLIGLALAAVRLLPAIETTAQSPRAEGLGFELAAQGSIAPWNLILGYLYPSFEIPRVLEGTLNAEELLYLGLLTPALVLLALIVGWRRRLVRFLALLVALSWILAMGSYSLGFPLVHRLPLFEFFRQPARFGLVAGFGLAYLVGLSIDYFSRDGIAGSLAMRWLTRGWLWLAGLIAAGTAVATIVLTGFAFLIVPYGYDYIDRVIVGSEDRFLSAERYYRTFDQLYGRMETAFSLAGGTPRLILVAALLSALVLWLYRRGTLAPRHAPAAMALILAVDVLVAPGHAIPVVPEPLHARVPQVVDAMEPHPIGNWRVFSYRGLAQKFELSTATGDRLTRERRDLLEYIFMNETLTPNAPLDWDLESIDGYENLMSRSAAEYLAYVGSERTTVPGFAVDPALDADDRRVILADRLPALAAANVRYLTSGAPLEIPGLREVFVGDIELPEWAGVTQSIHLYELEAWRPRVFVARDWTVVPPERPIPAQLASLAVPGTTLVDREPRIPRADAGTGSDTIGPLVSDPERLSLTVDLAAPAVVVVSEAMAPGWTATVDGSPVELLTANVVMRGVAVPAGVHTIDMRFDPPGYRAGIVVSLVGVALLLALGVIGLWADRS